MQTFKVGFIGAGYVSAHHALVLESVPNAELVSIVDLDVQRARAVADRFHIKHVASDLADFFAQPLDVVHVLTPPESHCQLSVQALAAGAHVLVEKPMAASSAECDQMIAAAAKAGRTLSVNHSARFDPMVLKAINLASSGACGEILGADFIRSSDYPAHPGGPLPPHYRSGSYPFTDLGIHGLSIMESFLGQAISCDSEFWHQGTNEQLAFDEWRSVVRCERGVGRMYLSWNSRPVTSEIIVHGTRGRLHVDCFLQTCDLAAILPGPKFLSNVVNEFKKSVAHAAIVPLNVLKFATGRLQGAPGIHVCVRRFYESLANNAAPPVPADEGMRLISVMQPTAKRADAAAIAERTQRLNVRSTAPVLITGAAGFLGARVVQRLLARGERIRILTRRPSTRWQSNPLVDHLVGDLGDPEIVDAAVRGTRIVIHVGATMKGSGADFERGTVCGTQNIVDSCLRHKVEHLVYVSSLSIFDHAQHDGRSPVHEDHPYEPFPALRGYYTQTKLKAEQRVLEAVRDFSLSATVLRPGQIFGPGAEHIPPPGVLGFGSKWVVVGSGRRKLPMVYVEDVVDAIVEAASARTRGIFNLVDAGSVDQKEYLRALTSSKIHAPTILYVPQWTMMCAGILCELLARVIKRDLPLSRYRVRSIRPLYPVDSSMARTQLSWEPRVGIAGGLSRLQSGEPDAAQSSTAAK